MESLEVKSKVVLINQTSGYLMVDIVNAYTEYYDEVVLIAGSIDEFDRKLKDKVLLKKICKYNRSTFASRGFTWILATLQIFFLLFFKYRNSKVVYVTNPPMSYFPAFLLKNEYSIVIYDIYPDALLNLGIGKKSLIFKFWKKINRKIFNGAVNIYTLSDGMAKLLSEYCDINKIKIIPNWGASDDIIPMSKKKNQFLREHNLYNKFVVMYSGNMGVTHNVEIMIELAEKLKDDDSIVFYFIGEGAKKKELMDIVKRKLLNNCFFLTWQDPDRVRFSLSAADLSIITLTEDTAQVSVPSKTYNLLAVGSPILCIAPQNTELGRLVEEYSCGKCFDKSKINDMVDFIKDVYYNEDYKKEISDCSIKASTNFTYLNAKKYVF